MRWKYQTAVATETSQRAEIRLLRSRHPWTRSRIPFVDYGTWSETLKDLEVLVKHSTKWASNDVRNVFTRVSLPEWWFSLMLEEKKSSGIDWKSWKEKTFDDWTKRLPEVLPLTIQWMVEDLEELDAKVRAFRARKDRRDGKQGETSAKDVEMETEDAPRPDTPIPPLATRTPSPKIDKPPCGQEDIPPLSIDETRDVPDNADPAEDPIPDIATAPDIENKVFDSLENWNDAVKTVQEHLNRGQPWSSNRVRDAFVKIGALKWWSKLNEKRESGELLDWKKWKDEEVEEGIRRIPEMSPETVRRMVNDLEALDRWAQDSITLRYDDDNDQPLDDNAMDTSDVPEDPELASTPAPDDNPPLADPDPNENQPPATVIIDAADFKVLKKRIFELEKRVGTTTEAIKKKIERIMGRMANDNMEWQVMKQRAEEMEGRTKAGKRGYRKANGRTHTHQYPTRYSAAQADDIVELSAKEYSNIDAKMKKLEGKIEDNQNEIGRLSGELTKVEKLASKIELLTSSFDTFRLNQVRVNFSTFREVSSLKSRLLDNVETRLNLHSREVANLNDRYAGLQALAIQLLSKQHAHSSATGSKPRASSYPAAPFPSHFAVPKMLPPSPLRKAIAL